MTVFVVHGVRDDISPARKFGDLRLVNQAYIHGDELLRTDDDYNMIPTGHNINIRHAVDDFKPDVDFLLIAGDHLQLLAMTARLAAAHGSFDVLRYDRQLNDYIPVRLHSGLVPPPATMVESGTNIGDYPNGEDRRVSNSTARFLASEIRAGIEAPLSRRDPTKRPA